MPGRVGYPEMMHPIKRENLVELSPGQKELLSELNREFDVCLPKGDFDEVSATPALSEFTDSFTEQAKSGSLSGFLDKASSDLTQVYIIRAPSKETAGKNGQAWENHQPEMLHIISNRFKAFLKLMGSPKYGALPSIYLEEYRKAAEFQLRFCVNVEQIGNPEFTSLQRTPKEWREILDIEASQSSGQPVLRFEKQVEQLLEDYRNNLDKQTSISVESALNFWALSPAEKSYVFAGEPIPQDKLTPEQSQRFFEVFLKRIKIPWKLEIKNSGVINVDSFNQVINFPATRELTGDEMIYLVGHEIGIHSARGHNGAHQDFTLLKTGLDGYLAFEEGGAAVSEMVLGQKFGDRRQGIFAARYLGIALSLKTKVENGKNVAMYSPQEIYDKLLSYFISEKMNGKQKADAQKSVGQVVWRHVRGTSLQHQVTQIEIESENGQFSLPVAETFVKDLIYTDGQIRLFEFLASVVPVRSEDRSENGKTLIHGKEPVDFSEAYLARIGRAIIQKRHEKTPQSLTIQDMKENYESLTKLGRKTLIGLLQYFLPGKTTLEATVEEDSPWKIMLKRNASDGVVKFERLFEPSE